ncbi:TIGR00366 family protein [Enterocloster lavalensis]|uniref:TIGR00366 family protein n=1 Tax=Enterocloster lavalensis TaxID=460384 RepID=UPI002A8022A1|nr:TIGR00366 family protein [Enterocloster lavalensis]
MSTGEKAKKGFKMPHLFWIMMGLLLFACLLTYIIPAGEFAVDENGKILGDQFSYLGHQNPVAPWRMFMLILQGLGDSGLVIWTVLTSGAMTAVVMATGAIDELLNWAIYKLKDKSENILITIMFVLMVYLGGFGGTDALIAVVPIGVIFTKKLKLDPICAIGVSSYATLLGFGTGPTKQFITQLMMGVPVYGAFFTMFISMNFFMLLGLFLLLRYVKKIRKDPTKSLMWSEGWNPANMKVTAEEEAKLSQGTKLSGRTIAILVLFLGQYGILVAYPLLGGDGNYLQHLMTALALFVAIVCGFIGGFSFDKVGDEFVKGLQGLVFVGFVIGLAKVMSLVLAEGMVIHTMVYVLTRPLMDLSRAVSSIGMTAIICVVNLLIPSATSKAAILVPILKPIAETLNMDLNVAVQAFQYGDGFTNMVSPFLGWTVGSCVMAGVPFPKWFKWVFPKVIAFILISFVIMYVLTESGWTAF